MSKSGLLFFWMVFQCITFEVNAQKSTKWTDSIYASLDEDKLRDSYFIMKYGDTLLYIFDKTNDPCRWIKTQLYISRYQKNAGWFKEAYHSISLAKSRFQKSVCGNQAVLSEIYFTYASLYYFIAELKKADYYTRLGIKCWDPAASDKEFLIRLYHLKGALTKDLKSQLYFLNLAYDIALQTNHELMQEYTLNAIGTAYAEHGDVEQGKACLEKSLAIAMKKKDYHMLSSIYNNLAGISQSSKEIQRYLDSVIYYSELSGDLDDLQIAYQNQALVYYNNREFEKGYDQLWYSFVLKDSLYNQRKMMSFAEMEQKYESAKKITEIALLKSENKIATLESSRRLVISLGLGGALIAIVMIAFAFYIQKKRKQKLNTELVVEKKKSDDLLLNILPEEVAEELKQTGYSRARLYNNVSVLFTDFVNFTGISEKLSPTELVQEIHKNFTAFDAIIEKHGLEKIKTIGDAYLAVCGLPHELPDHALRVVRAAIDIRKFMKENDGKFLIRMGVHSGPVVAGIVGVKKYAYDIWGDTVNMANRMESNSEAGKINISGATYNLIKDVYNCSYRGKIQAKNKGEVDMYFID